MAIAVADEGQGDDLPEALRAARDAEWAHYRAHSGFWDAKSLRLQVLKDELATALADMPDALNRVELAAGPGEEPRLWIDLLTAVVMEPDPRSYRLVQDGEEAQVTLVETGDRAAMVEALKRTIAHREIARERAKRAAIAPAPVPPTPGFPAAALIQAWLAGFVLGAVLLVIIAILTGELSS